MFKNSSCLKLVFVFVVGFSSLLQANDISIWLSERLGPALSKMELNISPGLPGYKKGFVVAAPWTVPGVQNYRYHWVRDAALVMNTLVTRYLSARTYRDQEQYFGLLRDYVNFSKENQLAPETDTDGIGLGEVKFNPDGSRYTQWMRPQNDGPALRAITISRFARRLMRQGRTQLAQHLYDGSSPGEMGIEAAGVVQADLQYLTAHWQDVSFEPWEEVKGHSFYTRLVQRKALLDGIQLAKLSGDYQGAVEYRQAVKSLEIEINKHWIDAGQKTPSGGISVGQIWDSFDRVYGIDYKTTGLDSSVVLAALHAHNELDTNSDRFFSPSDDRVLKTAFELAKNFTESFPIAQIKIDAGGLPLSAPIGRYPKDKYNGYDGSHDGNPWFLTTAAFAELYYRCAEEWKQAGEVHINSLNLEFISTLSQSEFQAGDTIDSSDERFDELIAGLQNLGDTYLRRFKFHEGKDGFLTEEFSRTDGSLQGAENLSWSYASLLTAAEHRSRLNANR